MNMSRRSHSRTVFGFARVRHSLLFPNTGWENLQAEPAGLKISPKFLFPRSGPLPPLYFAADPSSPAVEASSTLAPARMQDLNANLYRKYTDLKVPPPNSSFPSVPYPRPRILPTLPSHFPAFCAAASLRAEAQAARRWNGEGGGSRHQGDVRR